MYQLPSHPFRGEDETLVNLGWLHSIFLIISNFSCFLTLSYVRGKGLLRRGLKMSLWLPSEESWVFLTNSSVSHIFKCVVSDVRNPLSHCFTSVSRWWKGIVTNDVKVQHSSCQSERLFIPTFFQLNGALYDYDFENIWYMFRHSKIFPFYAHNFKVILLVLGRNHCSPSYLKSVIGINIFIIWYPFLPSRKRLNFFFALIQAPTFSYRWF